MPTTMILTSMKWLFQITVFYCVLCPTFQQYAVLKIVPDIFVAFSNSTQTTTGDMWACARLCGTENCDYFGYRTFGKRCKYGISNYTYLHPNFKKRFIFVQKVFSNLTNSYYAPPRRYIIDGNFTQPAAAKECLKRGHILTTFKSSEDGEQVRQWLTERAPSDHMWIGLKYRSTFKNYVWDNGNVFQKESGWSPGEPKRLESKLCVVINKNELLLDSKFCNNTYSALCSDY